MPRIHHFNAYPNGAEPNWAEFDAIEIDQCVTYDLVPGAPEIGTGTTVIDPTNPADVEWIKTFGENHQHPKVFWCVFGHFAPDSGECGRESITDLPSSGTRADALRVAAEYQRKVEQARQAK